MIDNINAMNLEKEELISKIIELEQQNKDL